MKKFMTLLVLCLGCFLAAGTRAADPDVLFRESVRSYMASNGVNRAGVTNVLFGSVLPPCNGGSVTNINAASAASGNLALARVTNAFDTAFCALDTNAVTVATGYSPAYRGQFLFGLSGVGTNGVWVAKGLTTNDWVKVAP